MTIYKQSNDSLQHMAKQPDVSPHWPKALVARIYGEYAAKPITKEDAEGSAKIALPQ